MSRNTEKANRNNRADQKNPNNPKGRDNRANQKNPNQAPKKK